MVPLVAWILAALMDGRRAVALASQALAACDVAPPFSLVSVGPIGPGKPVQVYAWRVVQTAQDGRRYETFLSPEGRLRTLERTGTPKAAVLGKVPEVATVGRWLTRLSPAYPTRRSSEARGRCFFKVMPGGYPLIVGGRGYAFAYDRSGLSKYEVPRELPAVGASSPRVSEAFALRVAETAMRPLRYRVASVKPKLGWIQTSASSPAFLVWWILAVPVDGGREMRSPSPHYRPACVNAITGAFVPGTRFETDLFR